MNSLRKIFMATVLVCGCFFVNLHEATAKWRPSKPVELWVTFGKGAHADIWAKRISSLVAKYRLSPVPFQVVNIPTGAGVVAFPKFQKLIGADHTLMLVLPNVFTIPLFRKNVSFDIRKMTPIAMMGEEPLALWVKSNRDDIRSINDFVEVARKMGRKFRMTGPPLGTPRAMLVEMIASLYGLDLSYDGIRKIGSTARRLAQKDYDATIHNPSELADLPEPQAIRPIAILAHKRIMGEYLTVPTLRETGMAITYSPSRTVIGPPGMPEAARLYYSRLFRKVFATREWQDMRKKKGHVGNFMTGAKLASYLSERAVKHVRWKMAIEQLRTH